MRVLIIGANGKVGRHMVKMLGLSTEHEVKAMIRSEDQREKMEELGADEIVIADLEKDFSHAYEGVDAVIFTAGSGGHTSSEQTEVIDREAAIRSIEEAEKHGMARYIIISAVGAGNPEKTPEGIRHYMKAKGAADEALINSRLNYTILRPGALSDDDAKGTITAARELKDHSGEIPREDVASAAVNSLTIEETEHQVFELLSGDTSIGTALKGLKQSV
ncbi:SDR family oxidoreductase [Alteribacter natronophilus]|uniref:SDR family oxidoreductase n=1 Tax=Alteribacter natronophilus TaxID=2583810 RepID=UPI00110DCBF6|nr:SDR family oxidoreductase [Alteribacter natronophilus]TMW70443.1 SDR family oxidoreductase [Alteribacter natronophilus]